MEQVLYGNTLIVYKQSLKKDPHAIYTHYANHRMNIVIVDVTKNIEEAELFFNLLQELYVIFSSSIIHS